MFRNCMYKELLMSEPVQSTVAGFDRANACASPTRCPMCGGPNGCRMETREGFKGPCWCAKLTVDPAALERLTAQVAERRCLCRTCLESIAT